MTRGIFQRLLALSLLLSGSGLLLSGSGCYPDRAPFRAAAHDQADASVEGGAGATSAQLMVCTQASAEAIPARNAAMSASSGTAEVPVFTSGLFGEFNQDCGRCHVDTTSGTAFKNTRVNQQNFATLVDQDAIDAILSADESKLMPPLGSGGKLPSQQGADYPYLLLAKDLSDWLAHGRPPDVYYARADGSSGANYLLSKPVGMGMTNLGNCVPEPAGFASETTESDALDKYFAGATTLPLQLSDTDLTSLDSAALGRRGIVAFAPGYPLWSDNARKIRYVRVPRGESIRFDPTTQRFAIPENTRFYKTFLKQIVDSDGNTRYRKIETRLIVARRDTCQADGSCEPNALFGTYVWSDDESEAKLLTLPLSDGTPFADKVITYVTDEAQAAKVKDPEAAGLIRHYALPGLTRCVQCHRGSINHDSILGFQPLQIARRPQGEGGVIEPAEPDELNQLQHLMALGVITGLNSPADVTKLEDSQLPRTPRNNYELVAQGYMLGNCSHCHNEHGFASVKNPELRPLLNFLPHVRDTADIVGGFSDSGGIFQFPLDRTSPRIFRGVHGDVTLPYITPSLYDIEPLATTTPPPPGISTPIYTPKTTFHSRDGESGYDYAPWRSLIYRNVDTPFAYAEDYAIFPHMPKNTAGYDCRAPRILAEWMISIPASIRKDIPGYGSDQVPPGGVTALSLQPSQPFVEELPPAPCTAKTAATVCPPNDLCIDAISNALCGNTPGCVCRTAKLYYPRAIEEAQQRLDLYHNSGRYSFCPNTTDILDPDVVSGRDQIPQDNGYAPPYYPVVKVKDGVPDRAHWFALDLTDEGGPWKPRRSDWQQYLLDDTSDGGTDAGAAPDAGGSDGGVDLVAIDKARVLETLKSGFIRLDGAFRSFALQELPLAYWDQKGGSCDDVLGPGKMPRPADFSAAQSMRWLSTADNLPVYSASPGATVFTQICRNCHGPQADGHSTLADTISDMTGGQTRVANLHDGLFGPPLTAGSTNLPGTNRIVVFGDRANELDMSSDSLAARYLAWMALGGTQKVIPDPVLIAVSNTLVFGLKRGGIPPTPSANMLAAARQHCGDFQQAGLYFQLVPSSLRPFAGVFDPIGNDRNFNKSALNTSLIWSDGDAEFWERVCSFNNPSPGVYPLRILADDGGAGDFGAANPKFAVGGVLFRRAAYPANAPVAGNNQVYPSLSDTIAYPWCIDTRSGSHPELAGQFASTHPINGAPLPICPTIAFSDMIDLGAQPPELIEWAVRGAANAGMSVFVYIDAISRGRITPKPLYNECESLRPNSAPDAGATP